MKNIVTNNDHKEMWINAILRRNDNKLDAPLTLPNGLLSKDGITFNFKGGSFTIDEAKHYMEHGSLGTQIKHDSERLTKRETVALRIYIDDTDCMDIAHAFLMADAFLEESSK